LSARPVPHRDADNARVFLNASGGIGELFAGPRTFPRVDSSAIARRLGRTLGAQLAPALPTDLRKQGGEHA
jgi:hypothetical protein